MAHNNQASGLQARIKEYVEQLAGEVERAKSSAPLVAYLRAAAMFRDYSFANCCLIIGQRPDASRVSGYRSWQKLGRQVKRGAKAIWILAPITHRKRDEHDERSEEPEIVTTFRSVPVFDIADTTGDPLPEAPVLTGASCNEDLSSALTLFVDDMAIIIRAEKLPGSAMGLSKGGVIVLDESLEGADFFSVAVHELAHELLRHRDRRAELSRKDRELEAEAAAFAVCSFFNVETSAPSYLCLHGVEGKDVTARLAAIVNVSNSIIAGIENHLNVLQQPAPAINQ